jgi:hypothetical protein
VAESEAVTEEAAPEAAMESESGAAAAEAEAAADEKHEHEPEVGSAPETTE